MYSLLTLLPLIIVTITFFTQSKNLLERETTENYQKELSETANLIDERLYSISKRLITFSEQPLLYRFLEEQIDVTLEKGQGVSVDRATFELIRSEWKEFQKDIGDFIENLFLIDSQGNILSAIDHSDLQFEEAYKLLPFEFERMPMWAFFHDYERISVVMKLFAVDGEAVIGYLIVTLDPDKLQELYTQYPKHSFYITNSDNVILSAHNRNQIGDILDIRYPKNLLQLREKSRYSEYLYIRYVVPQTGRIVREQLVFSLVVMLVAFVIVLFVTFWILQKITTPIQKLTRLMRKAEIEEYHLIDPIRSEDEIAILCEGYNQLVTRTKLLINTNYKNELLKKEAELKAIRMYINPHFLYNILEYLSIISQSEDKRIFIPEMIKNLSNLFRFSIIPGEVFVPLRQEIHFIDKYLKIHHYRLEEKLSYNFDLNDTIMNVSVPKLILLPLTENAIIHGIDRLPNGGKVQIRAYEQDYMLIIEIENDCPADINNEKQAENIDYNPLKKGLGSGLINVNERIRLHYGNQYGLEMFKMEGVTLVRVTLPIHFSESEQKP
jgi:two-component system sensor histidine kinase YesM